MNLVVRLVLIGYGGSIMLQGLLLLEINGMSWLFGTEGYIPTLSQFAFTTSWSGIYLAFLIWLFPKISEWRKGKENHSQSGGSVVGS